MRSKIKTASHFEVLTKRDFAGGGKDAVDRVTPCAMRFPSECNEPILEVALRALGTHRLRSGRSTLPNAWRHHWQRSEAGDWGYAS